ncbi:MAG: hypothetical protein N4Q64_01810 [Lactobacillus iners]|nr:hypothetical protein [Lactobacillus iners]
MSFLEIVAGLLYAVVLCYVLRSLVNRLIVRPILKEVEEIQKEVHILSKNIEGAVHEDVKY